MAEPFIQDIRPCEYRSLTSGGGALSLAGALEFWEDEHPEEVAEAHILKRDGALQDPMGSGARRFNLHCIYYGGQVPEQAGDTRTAYQRYRDCVTFFRENKRGVLVHMQLGKVSVAYRGISRVISRPGQEGDAVIFTISFAEDGVDQDLEQDNGAAAKAQQVNASALALLAQAEARAEAGAKSRALTAAILARCQQIVTLALNFVDTALAAYNAVQRDPSLLGVLGAILGATESLSGDLRAAGITGVDAAPYTQNARATVAGAVELYYATAGPQPETITIGQTTSVPAICQARYRGGDQRAKAQEIQMLNPQLRNPAVVPAGSRLRVPPES